MITRRVRIQLMIFSTLTASAVSLIVFHYVKVPAIMGIGQVQSAAIFSQGAGIYPEANVTFRGVTVGKVTAVGLADDGVRVSFRVASSADVPADVTATIKSVSAIGEQYVDLVPRGIGGPLLADGDVIPRADTAVPVATSTVLDDADHLLSSVPSRDLRTVLDEADHAFDGLGPQLTELTTSATELVEAARANYPQTHKLLVDGSRFLDGQRASSESMRLWSRHLASFTSVVRRGDASLRSLLDSVPPAANQADLTVRMASRELPRLISSGRILADLAADYHAGIQQVLVVYPLIAMKNVAFSTVHPGAVRLGFKTIANYPGSCSTGWPKVGEPLGPRGPEALADEPSADDVYCKIPQDDPRVVRGARNLPCSEPGSPPGRRAATIQQCLGAGYAATASNEGSVTVTPEPVEQGIGTLFGVLRPHDSDVVPTVKERSWQSLLLAPLGRS